MVATIFLAFLLQYRLPDASNKYYSEREQYDTERHRLTIGQRKKYISFFSNVDDTTYLYRALVDLRDVEETHAKTMAYHWIGKYYVYRQSDSAYYYLLKARKLESNTAQKADIDFNLCLLNYDIEDYLQAEKYGLLCLRGAKNSGLNKMKSSASSLLGTIYVRIGDFTAAEKYFENALAFNTSNDVETNLLIFNNLGNLFEEKRNYRKAISFYKRGLSNRKLNLFPEIKARLEDNLGYSYFRLGDETGIKLLHQALKARLRLRNLPDILYSKQHIVDYLLKHDSIPQAIELAEQVLAQSRRHNLLSSEVNMLAVLVAYERVAGIYGKQYVDRERLLKNNRAILNTKLSRIEFETEELEKEHLKSERLIILIVTFAAVSILVLSIIIVLSRNKILNAKIAYKRAEEKHSDEIYNLILKSRQDKRKARIKEKQSIAMELHDSVMSRLSTVRLNLFSLNSELSISPAFVDTIEEIKSVEMEIRNISHELCFVTEEKIGQDFHKIIVDLIKKNKNLQINFTNLVDLVHVDASFQIHIYRILQEAFNNISRHSLDRSGRLSFEMIDDELVITIENEVARRQGEIKKSGIGLRNIDARVTAMNARLKVQISGQFFRIKINVPKIV